MHAQSRPQITIGSIIGIASLLLAMAMLKGGVGGEALRELARSGGAATVILALGVLMTMALTGISAIASITLYAVTSTLGGALALLERGRTRRTPTTV